MKGTHQYMKGTHQYMKGTHQYLYYAEQKVTFKFQNFQAHKVIFSICSGPVFKDYPYKDLSTLRIGIFAGSSGYPKKWRNIGLSKPTTFYFSLLL
jgi:hypothetical protein